MKNRRLVVEHIIYEIFGNGNLSSYDSLVGSDVKIHHPPCWEEIFPPYVGGRKKTKIIDQEYAKAFQIKKNAISDMLSDQNKILVRWDFDATHKGNFFNIKATHRHFNLTGQTIYRFNAEEKVEEVWQAWDFLSLFRQIKGATNKSLN